MGWSMVILDVHGMAMQAVLGLAQRLYRPSLASPNFNALFSVRRSPLGALCLLLDDVPPALDSFGR